MNPDWQLVIAAVALLVTLIGYLLTRRGKRRDELQAEKAGSWARMIGEAEYLAEQLKNERVERATEKTEWDAWRRRQMIRCRAVTDSLVNAITGLRADTPSSAADADVALRGLVRHDEDDHDGANNPR